MADLASTGRNFQEILRVIDSLQLTDHHQVATPVNWKDGDGCLVMPAIPNDEALNKFPKGVIASKPYMRMPPQSNKYGTQRPKTLKSAGLRVVLGREGG